MANAWRPVRAVIASVLVLFVALLPRLGFEPARVAAAGPQMTGLHVVGNQIRNGRGETVRLLGVNRAGLEYACVQGWGLFEGPSDDASVAAIAAWGVNTVRIPVNGHCWLGINGVPAAYGGATYQAALADYIARLNAHGLAAIIDLHWTAPGSARADAQTPMADRDHAPAFWAQVAAAYKGNSAVLFDLFNEPYPDNNTDTPEAWRCWRDGGTCAGVGYEAAGMQELVNAVRGTGATNIVILSGVNYAAHLSRWLQYRPTDPTGNVAASWHLYNFSQCNTRDCWDREAAPVAAQVPLIAGEIGQNDCAHNFIDQVMDWHDARGASYLGWTWNTWSCQGSTALISDYNGTPTNYGIGLKNRLASQTGASPRPAPSAAPTATAAATAPATSQAPAPSRAPSIPSATPPPAAGPIVATLVDELDDFGKIATHSRNLTLDTTNAGALGNDPSRLVRTARGDEWATWQVEGMRSFAVTTYALSSDRINYFSFAASPDDSTYTAVSPAITDDGGDWRRITYRGEVPEGTRYLRITFPNSSAAAQTPQIGQVAIDGGAATPPTPGASAGAGGVSVMAMLGGSSDTQESQYRLRLHNDSGNPQRGLKMRIYLDLSELLAAGLTARDVATAIYWDQCGGVAAGPITAGDAGRALYYVELTWGDYTLPARSSCELHLSIHTADWQQAWSSANDPSARGLTAGDFAPTEYLPVYRDNALVYGVEP